MILGLTALGTALLALAGYVIPSMSSINANVASVQQAVSDLNTQTIPSLHSDVNGVQTQVGEINTKVDRLLQADKLSTQ